MPLPSLMVYERTGAWARAITREVVRAGFAPVPRVLECRSSAECRSFFSGAAGAGEASRAMFVVESDPDDASDVCELLHDHQRRLPRVPRIVVGVPSNVDYEPLYREWGALAMLTSPRALQPLVDVYRRYCELPPTISSAADSEEPRSLTEQFQATLPWGRVTR
ncbi:MAG: hypothetical protein C0483_26005 [Pirellula sp.]|nr:hypothetical protein [Pirellula sp.]